MGLFDFVKGAGAKLGGPKPAKAGPQVRQIDFEKLGKLKQAKALRDLVAKLGLEVEGLKIEVDGSTAVVHGEVDSQAEREKVVLAIGNVIGIARVDDRLVSKPTEPPAQFHTVVSGDTLSKIAKRYYGNAAKYPLIFEANRPLLKDPDKIYPGQVLRIPALPG